MTTINDRLERLEDAFVQLGPRLETIIGILGEHTTKLDGHTQKLDTIISAINTQSSDITLIKGYLG